MHRGILAKWFALMAIASLSFAGVSMGADSITATGGVGYKMPNGSIVHREAKLEIPGRGKGKIVLRSGNKSVESHAFWTKKNHGRTIFNVVFLDPPGAPKKTAVVFSGTYIRGTNAAYYYGDFYSGSYAHFSEQEAEIFIENGTRSFDSDERFIYQGGFMFHAKVPKSVESAE